MKSSKPADSHTCRYLADSITVSAQYLSSAVLVPIGNIDITVLTNSVPERLHSLLTGQRGFSPLNPRAASSAQRVLRLFSA